ncbi:MAG: hypothetical protein M1829_005355 [Trizodia sp. TS-e1964]|nr:MAG: hypothetical protein M1829_005355 [Trizodia sp. TS-e1964]
MVELEFESGQWSNITTAGQYSASGMSVGGSAQFVPSFGKAGILVLLGGDTPLSTFSSGNTLRSLSNITVYDPTSKLWYSQTATGDVPASRIDICIAGAQSTNSSTYEIFVYGGWIGSFSSTDNSDSHNVYILTLPAFRWIRAAASTLPRAGSSCQVVNSQMISFGGWDPTGTLPFTTADPFTYGVGVFDLTSLSWNNGFNASARPYMRSDLVTAFYAKNALSPASWDNPLLAAVFANSSATQATTSATGAPTSLPTPSGSSSSNPSQTASATSLGPIIGSVIGGVVLIAALTALWWFCFRNRKSPPSQPAELEPQQTIINPKPERMVELGPPRPWELNTPNEAPRELDTGAPQNPTGPVVYHEVHG